MSLFDNKKVITGSIIGLAVIIVGLFVFIMYEFLNEPEQNVAVHTPPTRPPIADGPTAPPIDPQSYPNVGGITDQEYITAIEQELGTDYNDQDLLTIGHNVCEVVGEYGVDSYMDNLQVFADNLEMTLHELAIISVAAIITYCPGSS